MSGLVGQVGARSGIVAGYVLKKEQPHVFCRGYSGLNGRIIFLTTQLLLILAITLTTLLAFSLLQYQECIMLVI